MSPSRLDRVHDKFRARLLAGERRAVQQIGAAYRNVWRDLEPRVESLVEAVGPEFDPKRPYKVFQHERAIALQRLVAAEMQAIAPTVEGAISTAQSYGALQGRDGAIELIEAAYGDLGREMVELRRLPRENVLRMVGNLQDGSPLRDMTKALGQKAGMDVRRGLVTGMALGLNPMEVARQTRQAFGGNLNRAAMVARTEMMRVHRTTTLEHFNENSSFVGRWMWQATLDDRCCMACVMMHGAKFGLEKQMETHPGCRCRMSPLPKDSRFESFRGETWFNAQSPERQRYLMGGDYYAAWQDGQFALRSLVKQTSSPDWGGGRTVAPLGSLVTKNGLARARAIRRGKTPTKAPEYKRFYGTDQFRQKLETLAQAVPQTPQMRQHEEIVRIYKGSGYRNMNAVMRGTFERHYSYMDPARLEAERRGVERQVALLDDAFNQAAVPVGEDMVALRGGAIPEIAAAANRGENVVGKVYGDRGYLSVSLNERTADNFLRGTASAKGRDQVAMIEFQLPAQQRAIPMQRFDQGDYSWEQELLLGRDTKWKIVEQDWYLDNRGDRYPRLVVQPAD